jgi:hypothetical protein
VKSLTVYWCYVVDRCRSYLCLGSNVKETKIEMFERIRCVRWNRAVVKDSEARS